MVMKNNVLLAYHNHMAYQYFTTFKSLIVMGTLVKDVVKRGYIKKDETASALI